MNENAVCVDVTVTNYQRLKSNASLFHFYTCASNVVSRNKDRNVQSAARVSYHSDLRCVDEQQFEGMASFFSNSECHCNWDSCNRRTTNVSLPAAKVSNATMLVEKSKYFVFRDCYTGMTSDWHPLFSGGSEPCQGVCAKFAPFKTEDMFYGCVPVETLVQVNAPSADSTVTWHNSSLTFCSTSLCNTVPLPPKPSSKITCYTGLGVYDYTYNLKNFTFYARNCSRFRCLIQNSENCCRIHWRPVSQMKFVVRLAISQKEKGAIPITTPARTCTIVRRSVRIKVIIHNGSRMEVLCSLLI